MSTPSTTAKARLNAALLQQLLDTLGSAPGSILIRGPATWIALPPGTLGQVLVIGSGGYPEWVDPSTVNFG